MNLDDALFWGTVAFLIFGSALWATGFFMPEPKRKSNLEQVLQQESRDG